MADSTPVSLPISGEVSSGVQPHAEQLVAQLYGMHAVSLHRYLLMTGSAAPDADELVQEAFLRLFRCVREGERVDSPKAWLIRVLQNLRTDRMRREHTHAVVIGGAAVSNEPVCDNRGPSPEEAMIEQQRFDRLQRGMKTLSERQHDYLVLRSEGMTLREIAEIHGVAVQSVAETCARAIERLRKFIHE